MLNREMHKFQNKRCSLPPDHVPAVFFTHNWVMAFSSLQNFEDRAVSQKYERFWTEIWNQRHGCNMEYLDEKKYETSGNVKDFERRVWGSHLIGEVWMFPRKRELRNVCRDPCPFFSIFQLFSIINFFQYFPNFQYLAFCNCQYFPFFSIINFFQYFPNFQCCSKIRGLLTG